MPPIIRFNNTANKNASDIARRAQARTIYANALVNQKTLDQNCLNRVAAGPAATTSYSGSKVVDQRVGAVFTTPVQAAEIVASSPCSVVSRIEPIVYPNYVLSCSDPAGIQIMASGTFTSFTFTTETEGAGVLEFQYFFQDNYVSSDLVVLGQDSNLITPPPGIDEVRYVFKCNPIQINIDASGSTILQWTNPYCFTYTTGPSSLQLTLYKHPIASGITVNHIININDIYTPTPSWGWDMWSISMV